MNKIIKLGLCFYSSYFAFWPFRRQSPTDEDVRRELLRILSDNPFGISFEKINFDLSSLFKTTSMLMWIAVPVGFLIGIIFLVRNISPYIQNDSGKIKLGKASSKGKQFIKGNDMVNYQQALRQAKAGAYRQAIISLHKATIDYLLGKVITSSSRKKYTNNDLKKKLKDAPNLYQPFALIADYAEIAGFSTIALTDEDFTKALTTYEKNFLVQ